MVTDPEDATFLQLQRQKGRPGCMIGVDKFLGKTQKRRLEREEQEKERTKRSKVQNEVITAVFRFSSTESSELADHKVVNDEMVVSKQVAKEPIGKIECITPDLLAVFDRCKTSDIQAVRIFIAAARAFQRDPKKYIHPYRVWRRRISTTGVFVVDFLL